MLSAQQVADKWAAGASSTKYQQGIQACTLDPPRLAIAQKSVMVQRYNDAINSGKWENNLGQVSAQQWQQAAATKGAQNYATGVNAAKPKMVGFLTQFLPFVDNLRAQIRQMPKGPKGGAESMARIQANMQGMMSFGRSGGRR